MKFTEKTQKEARRKFDCLYDKYYFYAYKIAFEVIHDTQEMEDVMQAVFLNVWKITDKITDEPSAKALVAVIARNTAINEREKRANRSKNIVDVCDERDYDCNPTEEECRDPQNIIVSRENINYIYSRIKSMKPIYSDVLILHHKFGFTPEMIAATLGVNIKTVYSRIRRGNEFLKQELLQSEVYSNE